jgi:hypothetical protein
MKAKIKTSLLASSLIISAFSFGQSKKDTLVIPKTVKVIVIDGVFFDIRRFVEVTPASHKIHVDTLQLWNPRNWYIDTSFGGLLKIEGKQH